MNKQESQNLMIGSWVLAGGEPRQVCSITTKKAGFKRGTSGHRDFFRFDQLQGIPLSDMLLRLCLTFREFNPSKPLGIAKEINSINNTFCVHTSMGVNNHSFNYLHEVQAVLLSAYGLETVFDTERYKYLQQPEIAIPKEQVDALRKKNPTMKNVPDVVADGDTLLSRLDSMNKCRHLSYTKE